MALWCVWECIYGTEQYVLEWKNKSVVAFMRPLSYQGRPRTGPEGQEVDLNMLEKIKSRQVVKIDRSLIDGYSVGEKPAL